MQKQILKNPFVYFGLAIISLLLLIMIQGYPSLRDSILGDSSLGFLTLVFIFSGVGVILFVIKYSFKKNLYFIYLSLTAIFWVLWRFYRDTDIYFTGPNSYMLLRSSKSYLILYFLFWLIIFVLYTLGLILLVQIRFFSLELFKYNYSKWIVPFYGSIPLVVIIIMTSFAAGLFGGLIMIPIFLLTMIILDTLLLVKSFKLRPKWGYFVKLLVLIFLVTIPIAVTVLTQDCC